MMTYITVRFRRCPGGASGRHAQPGSSARVESGHAPCLHAGITCGHDQTPLQPQDRSHSPHQNALSAAGGPVDPGWLLGGIHTSPGRQSLALSPGARFGGAQTMANWLAARETGAGIFSNTLPRGGLIYPFCATWLTSPGLQLQPDQY